MKKWIAALLALAMVCSMIPAALGEDTPVYLALGDSLTTGYGLAKKEECFARILADANGYLLINRAVNGNTSSGLLEQMHSSPVLRDVARADLITITCGGNDLMGCLYQQIVAVYNTAFAAKYAVRPQDVMDVLGNDKDPRQPVLMMAAISVLAGNADLGIAPFVQSEEIKETLAAYLQNMGAVMAIIRKENPDVKVIMTTQFNPYGHFDGAYTALNISADAGVGALSKLIGEYADALGYQVADVYDVVKACPDNLMNASMNPLNMDVHPNAAGHALIAECIQQTLHSDTDTPLSSSH